MLLDHFFRFTDDDRSPRLMLRKYRAKRKGKFVLCSGENETTPWQGFGEENDPKMAHYKLKMNRSPSIRTRIQDRGFRVKKLFSASCHIPKDHTDAAEEKGAGSPPAPEPFAVSFISS